MGGVRLSCSSRCLQVEGGDACLFYLFALDFHAKKLGSVPCPPQEVLLKTYFTMLRLHAKKNAFKPLNDKKLFH